MKHTDDKFSALRERLKQPTRRGPKEGTAAAICNLLFEDIMAARAAGKTWPEIAADLSTRQHSYQADTIRIACSRTALRNAKAEAVEASHKLSAETETADEIAELFSLSMNDDGEGAN